MKNVNETYLIRVWDNIQQSDGTAKNVFTVVGVMKPRKDKDGNIQEGKFMIYPAKNLAITGPASVELYVKEDKGDTAATEDAEDQTEPDDVPFDTQTE